MGPAYWNTIDHLDELKLPEEDENIIVTIHYYSPMDFTHQGAKWAGREDKVGVEWKGTRRRSRLLKTTSKGPRHGRRSMGCRFS
ncbi:MAG: glycoside hydrolase family 5 protein [Thaumarchaeota archaeon]|nr:glycoside hydrolase family 5 protein [Nitrososphaerota archaeon]